MNALEVLAKTLKHHIEPRRLNADNDEFAVAVCKAQRIVAELARVRFLDFVNESFPNVADAERAVCKCRAIAEEGENEIW